MVPDDIKKVDRPRNTVVVDTGSKSSRRYAVRERSGYKKTCNNNAGPRNGKTIGYIVNGRYVPKSSIHQDVVKNRREMLQYGAAALVHSVCKDVYEDLNKCFTVEDANRIFTIASLRVTNPGIACNRYSSKAKISFISVLYPCIGLSKNSVSSLIENLGKAPSRLKEYYSLRLERVKEDQNLIVDGVLKQDTGDNTLSMPSAKTHLKGHKEISVIYAYNQEMSEVVCAKVYQGNMLDAKAFRDFILDNKITRGTIVCDKGFPVSKIADVLKMYPELHYIAPIKRNDSRIAKYHMLACDKVAVLSNGHTVMYKKVMMDDGTFMYSVRDVTRANAEKSAILSRALNSSGELDGQIFIDSLAVYGTITFLSDHDLDPLLIIDHYNNRWLLETVFDHFKNTLDLDITRVQSKASVIGNEFINFISTLMMCKIVSAFKRAEQSYDIAPLSIKTRLEDLRDIDRCADAPFRGSIDDGLWNFPARDRSMELLVRLDLADAPPEYIEQLSSKKGRGKKTCASSSDDAMGKTGGEEASMPTKRKPGRPAGRKNKEAEVVDPEFVGPMPAKRKRGRPAGSKKKEEVVVDPAFVGPMPARRKRGRPSGSKKRQEVVVDPAFVGPMPAKRKRGRPAGSGLKRSVSDNLQTVVKPYKRSAFGRSAYSSADVAAFLESFIGPMPAKRRPGRPLGSKTRRVYVQ